MFQNKEKIQKESQILHIKEIVKRDLNKIRISFRKIPKCKISRRNKRSKCKKTTWRPKKNL